MLDSRNNPLIRIDVQNADYFFSIHKTIIQKVISQLPEHKTIALLKRQLIDALCSARAAINSVFVNQFSSNYDIMHFHLFADNSSTGTQTDTSSLDGYDYKAYQIEFNENKNRLYAEDIKIEIQFRPNLSYPDVGFKSFSPALPLTDKYYICNGMSYALNDGISDGFMLSVRGYPIYTADVVEIKYDISNEVDFFTSSEYLKDPLNYKKHRSWRPFVQPRETFVVNDVKIIL